MMDCSWQEDWLIVFCISLDLTTGILLWVLYKNPVIEMVGAGDAPGYSLVEVNGHGKNSVDQSTHQGSVWLSDWITTDRSDLTG